MRVREGAGSLMVWLTVPRNYFFIFSLLSKSGFSFCSRGVPGGARVLHGLTHSTISGLCREKM